MPFYGKLSDLYGRKPLLMIGITLFLIGSALSGLSQTMEQLILFRGIQGLGAGALFPISLAVIGDLFTPAERGKYQGLFGAVFGVSFLIGPWLGGFLTDNVSWHAVFYVNLPIGIFSLWVIWRLLPTIKRKDAKRNLDILGGVLFTAAISLILIGLTNKVDAATFTIHEWTEPQVGGLIAVGGILLAAFLWAEIARQGSRSSRSTSGATAPTCRRCSRPSWSASASSARSSSCRAGSRSFAASPPRRPGT